MGSLLSRVVLGVGVASAVMIRGPATVDAQPAPGSPAPAPALTPEQKATLKKLVNDANAAMEAGNYDKAIALNEEAYKISSHPDLIFNIAQAHRQAGRLEQAIQFYEQYLQLAPDGREVESARTHLENLMAEVAAKQAEAPPPPPPMPAAMPEAPRRTDTVTSPGRGLRITGLALGGAGLVSAAVGVYFTTRVLHWESEAENEGPPFTNSKSKGEAAQLRGDIAYGLAGALVIGGAVTYYLGHRKDRDAQVMGVAPVIGADYAGIAISGSLR